MIRVCRPRRWPAQAMRLCAELCRRGSLLGRRYSVGTWAHAGPSHGWAVLDLAGAPVVLAPDAYVACRWWHDLETGAAVAADIEPLLPLRLDTDAEIEAREKADRIYRHAWQLDFWLDGLRRARAEVSL